MTFEEAYQNLNPRQKEAVDAVEGPVMVIAGPGTGKTQILTLRIANILKKTDVPADAILALTFTESAAANMRRRLVGLIGSRAYYVNIHTFHGFCNRLIQDRSEHFPRIVGAQSVSQVEQIAIVREILDETAFEYLTPFGDKYHYVRDILRSVHDAKNEGFGADDLAKRVDEERRKFEEIPDLYHEKGAHKGKMKGEYQKLRTKLEKNVEFVRVYRAYEAKLRERKLYDFEDMILETVRALETKADFLAEVQENFQYVLVDEHQDTNGAQNRVLDLLMGFFETPNLFVVGDEKQAIYRFQGASIREFLNFHAKYPQAKLVQLEANYRSTQAILDSAQSLIEKNVSKIDAPLVAHKKGPGERVRVISFGEPEAEYLFLADAIEERLRNGTPASEIAVLYRENKDAFPLAEFLEKKGVPFAIESDQDVLQDPEVRKLLALFEAVGSFGNDEKLARALHVDFLGFDPLDLYMLLAERDKRRVPLYRLLRRPAELAGAIEEPELFEEWYAKLRRWRIASENENFLPFFERFVRESGYLAHILAEPGYVSHLDRLHSLFEEAKKLVGNRGSYKLSDFLGHLSILREHGVMVKTRPRPLQSSIRLMTAHKAKGLEFDVVFIIGATDGHWGNKRSMSHFELPFRTASDATKLERNEDERRIFYMALTRARHEVCVTWSSRSKDGREQVPSQFLEEIRPELRIAISGAEYENRFLRERDILFAPRRVALPSASDKDFVAEIFRERGLYATAVNAYLKCPWLYFYGHLLRIPAASSRFQIYGNSVHGALQDLFGRRREGEPVGAEYLVDRFKAHLDRYPLVDKDREEIRKKGERILPAYFAERSKAWTWRTLTEFRIQAKLDDITLKGNLDKVELGDAPGEVTVVDYKTKAPESREWIEGKTKNSNGDYKRQLIFYKLLLELYPEKAYRMTAGAIDFIEPNASGKFKIERFEIEDKEVEEMKELVRGIAEDVLDLRFWEERCGEKDCEFCELRDMMGASVGSDLRV